MKRRTINLSTWTPKGERKGGKKKLDEKRYISHERRFMALRLCKGGVLPGAAVLLRKGSLASPVF